jgi:hypothetical protein
MTTTKKYIIWILTSFALAFALFWTFIDFAETYGVLIGTNNFNYPFGYGNSVPWYYSNATIYWIYCLICGLLNLIASILIIMGMIKKNISRMIFGIGITLIVFLIMIVSVFLIEPAA